MPSDRMTSQSEAPGFDVVTGAFSYSGAAIARKLLDTGRRVRTLTVHPGRAPKATPIEVRPLEFRTAPCPGVRRRRHR
jgi:nucleoside-diphosphate-sugar epimerase